MENSPLRYLNFDISLMLADKVRLAQEESARAYHDYYYEKIHVRHFLYGVPVALIDGYYHSSTLHDTIRYTITGLKRVWDLCSRHVPHFLDGKEPRFVKRRILLYEEELKNLGL